jgi:tetratricopeptide (TPR) repeat protein
MAEAPAALLARAAAHFGAGEWDAAAACAYELVGQVPDHFDGLHLLGVLCVRRGWLADGLSYMERAARLNPGHPLLMLNRCKAWLNLEQPERAEALARAVIAVQPNNADAFSQLGSALAKQDRQEAAVAAYRSALAMQPDYAPAHYNLGQALEALGRLAEAEAAFRSALDHAPAGLAAERMVDILGSLGRVLTAQGRAAEARALLAGARSDALDLDWFESLVCLQLGDYEAGWRAYEARWRVAAHGKPWPGAIVPDISRISGRRILLVAEQGRGDVIQFCRYARLLAERGTVVYVRVYDDVKRLVSTLAGVAGVVGEDEREPEHEIVAHLMSLPLAFGTTIDTVPAYERHLSADADRVAWWRGHLARDGGSRRIGLVWSSVNPGASRSMALARLLPLLDVPGTSFHALQKEISDADLALMAADGRIRDRRASLTDFAETAALIAALDLVITIDTAVAHIAGALGRPVWVLLPHVAEWRWGSGFMTPWYPSARLYRQPTPGDWDGLVGTVAVALGNQA